MSLNDYRRSVFAQWGEDGMIEKAFELIPDDANWCVEFGAWDGKLHSNTHYLLRERDWSGVVIEADPVRYKDLLATYAGNPRVTCVNKMVETKGENSLDRILDAAQIPQDFALLSIDIDGNEYHVWESLRGHSAKLVVIEFNPTIPNEIEFVQPADPRVSQGSSLRSLSILARAKGYELVGATDTNAFFVRDEYFELFSISDNSLDAIRPSRKYLTYLYQLYDGTLRVGGCTSLIWDDVLIPERLLQVVPRSLRFRPAGTTPLLRRGLRAAYFRFLRRLGRRRSSALG